MSDFEIMEEIYELCCHKAKRSGYAWSNMGGLYTGHDYENEGSITMAIRVKTLYEKFTKEKKEVGDGR